MPRPSSKRTATSVKSSDADADADARSAPKRSSRKGFALIDRIFDSYANASLGMIDPEGIEALCSDVGVLHTDVKMLMLAWKMEAEKQGYFTQDEWRSGLKALDVNTIDKLKKALPKLEKEVKNSSDFVNFYSYAFQYCLTEEKQRTVDIETMCVLLDIVLGSQFRLQVDKFIQFLKDQNDYKVISMDQWMGFFRFCNEVSFSDLKDYDSTESWPLILDNFVEWLTQQR